MEAYGIIEFKRGEASVYLLAGRSSGSNRRRPRQQNLWVSSGSGRLPSA